MTPDQISMATAFAVLVLGLGALFPKVMIFALALDDWWEVRDIPKTQAERMVADDEVVASALRVASVLITVIIGVVWVATLLLDLMRLGLAITIALGIVAQALLANVQGWRALTFRRAMSRVFTRTRRPIGTPPPHREGSA